MAEKRRVYQIAERMRAVIAMQLQRLSDPRFSLVTITSVNMSPDLRSAKVYWTVTGGAERVPEVSEALNKAAGVFRRELGGELGLRYIPMIKFYYDDTLDVFERTQELINKVHEADRQRSEVNGDE